jgi:acetyl-CoA acyltransferase
MSEEVVIIDAIRTPLGKKNGSLKDTRPDDLASIVIEKLMQRTGIAPDTIGDVVFGCVTQIDEQGWNVARLATLSAGLPFTVPATTINRACGSGQQSIHFASQAILAGDIDAAIAGGVESMSRVKMGSDGKDFSPKLESKYALVWQGDSAELTAKKWGVNRAELDAYSLESHQLACQALREGRFDKEIVSVIVGENGSTRNFDRDEAPREDTSLEKLASLKPAFREDGVITAGNASQISDGAAAMIVMSASKAKELGLKPRARILARVVVGSDPIVMLDGIIPATLAVLKKAGLSINDIDHFEVNEAFASPVLAWMKELKVNREKLNPNGGSIALGHPLGASGTRIMTTMLHEMERTGARYGLQTMCIAHGQATATIVELTE